MGGTHFEGMISTSKKISFADLAAAAVWQMIFAIGALEVFWENKYPATENAGFYGRVRRCCVRVLTWSCYAATMSETVHGVQSGTHGSSRHTCERRRSRRMCC